MLFMYCEGGTDKLTPANERLFRVLNKDSQKHRTQTDGDVFLLSITKGFKKVLTARKKICN